MSRDALATRCGLSPASARLAQALTHRSATALPGASNERLEFLGDALLGAFVAEWLFENLPAEADEATLSRCRMAVVRKEALAEAARGLSLEDVLAVGNGEAKDGRQKLDRLLADAYEALVAAIYLDSGPDAARAFLLETLGEALNAARLSPPSPDPKSALQERLQGEKRGLPIYLLVDSQLDSVSVEVQTERGEILARGKARSQRLAEREAARQALEFLSSG